MSNTRPHTEKSKTMREHTSADYGEAHSLRRGTGVIGTLRLSSSALLVSRLLRRQYC